LRLRIFNNRRFSHIIKLGSSMSKVRKLRLYLKIERKYRKNQKKIDRNCRILRISLKQAVLGLKKPSLKQIRSKSKRKKQLQMALIVKIAEFIFSSVKSSLNTKHNILMVKIAICKHLYPLSMKILIKTHKKSIKYSDFLIFSANWLCLNRDFELVFGRFRTVSLKKKRF